MDIFYFYNGFNNIINLGLKDPHYMSNSELIMRDPLVIIKQNYCTKLVGGDGDAATGDGDAATGGVNAAADDNANGTDIMSSISNSLKQIKNLLPNRTLKEKIEEAKLMTIETTRIEHEAINASDERKRIKQKAEDAAKEASNAAAAIAAANTAKEKKAAKKKKKAAEAEKKKADKEQKKADKQLKTKSAAEKAELNKIFEELDAEKNNANNSDNSDDEKSRMSKIFDLIKLIIKILVFLACLTLLPIAPFVALSYYTYQKLKVYLSQNIQSL